MIPFRKVKFKLYSKYEVYGTFSIKSHNPGEIEPVLIPPPCCPSVLRPTFGSMVSVLLRVKGVRVKKDPVRGIPHSQLTFSEMIYGPRHSP